MKKMFFLYLMCLLLVSNYGLIYQDENRYSAGRGAHINLKRAERARVMISKIPGTSLENLFVS